MSTSIDGMPPLVTQDKELTKSDISNDYSVNVIPANQTNDISLNEKPALKKSDKKEANKIDYNQLANKIKESLNQKDLSVQFSLDKDTKKMIMKVINNQTKEVVQQYPPEVTLKIARMVTALSEHGIVANAKI